MNTPFHYIWRKKKIILLILIILYVGFFLLMPLKMAVSFNIEYVKTEQEAINLLPTIRGQVEVKEAKWGEGENQRILVARTKTINAVIMLYYANHHLDKEINGIDWLAVYQDYPYFFYGYLYHPLWLLFFKLT